MEPVWVPIVVAILMGPVVVVLQRLRKENTDQHEEGRILLRLIGNKVDKIGWHEGSKDSVEKED